MTKDFHLNADGCRRGALKLDLFRILSPKTSKNTPTLHNNKFEKQVK